MSLYAERPSLVPTDFYGRSDSRVSNSICLGRLLVFTWAYTGGHELCYHMPFVAQSSPDFLKTCFAEIMLDTPFSVRLVERICDALTDEYTEDEWLFGVFALLVLVSLYAPSILSSDEMPLDHWVRCVRLALQRQLCQGQLAQSTDDLMRAGMSFLSYVRVTIQASEVPDLCTGTPWRFNSRSTIRNSWSYPCSLIQRPSCSCLSCLVRSC